MTINQAKNRLEKLRNEARLIRTEISKIRSFLIDQGLDPDKKIDLTARNRKIFKAYKDGENFTFIGKKYNLSASRISDICKRINYIIRHKKSDYQKFT